MYLTASIKRAIMNRPYIIIENKKINYFTSAIFIVLTKSPALMV
jgi:hypothetical protein